MNEELEHRTQELHQLTRRYAETLRSMPWPVALVDDSEQIQLWNASAQRLFGIGETSVVGVGLDQLPVQLEVRAALIRRYRSALQKAKGSVLHSLSLHTKYSMGNFDIHFTPVFNNSREVEGVLIMFGPGSELASITDKPAKKAAKKVAPVKAAKKSHRSPGNNKK